MDHFKSSISKRSQAMVDAVLNKQKKVDDITLYNEMEQLKNTYCESYDKNDIECNSVEGVDGTNDNHNACSRKIACEKSSVKETNVLMSNEHVGSIITNHKTNEKTENEIHEKTCCQLAVACREQEETIKNSDSEQPINKSVTQKGDSCLVPDEYIDEDFNNIQSMDSAEDCGDRFDNHDYFSSNFPSTSGIVSLGEISCPAKSILNEHTLSDFSEDDDDSVKDNNYEPDVSTSSSLSTSSSSSCSSSTSKSSSNVKTEEVNNEASTNKENEPNNNSEKKLTRKRFRNEREWIRNKTKALRNAGKQYVSTGKLKNTIRGKSVREDCGEKCKYKCKEKISVEQRLLLFNEFYNLADINRKREFIVHHSDIIQPKYRRETNRHFNYAYYFTLDSTKIRVCKKYFKATLDINDRTVDTAQKKRTPLGTVAEDARGKHGNHTKVANVIKDGVRQHIMSIPRVESHYLRAQTTKEFIHGGKTIADLHRDYQALCKNDDRQSANYHMYSDIFNREFNISFFVPKKDQCNLCYKYQNADQEEKEKMETEYEDHQNEKLLSRNEMDTDKQKINKSYCVACFDMQAVLQIPKGDISIFYYRSKLNTMNFTITEISNDATQCYVWHEGEGGKGATEIGSCMLSYLQQKSIECDSDDLEIVLYSDNCSAQQKNRFLISVFMYAVMKFKIRSITHKYLVVGHTQNSGDSVHSTIEKKVTRSLKTGPIFVPDQFVTLIRLAKSKGNPYQVNELTHDDFVDVKQLMADFGSNFTINSKKEQVSINKLRIVRVEKKHPWQYFYKTSYSDLEFEHVNVRDPKKLINTRKSTKKIEMDSNSTDVPELKKAYSSKLPLNENKKKDLKFLLENNYIPKYYSPFYNSLF